MRQSVVSSAKISIAIVVVSSIIGGSIGLSSDTSAIGTSPALLPEPGISTTSEIFFNNAKFCLLIAVAGWLTMGIGASAIGAVSILQVAYFAGVGVSVMGYKAAAIVLLPHGIIEFAAIAAAIAAGIFLPVELLRSRSKKSGTSPPYRLVEATKFSLYMAVASIVLMAIGATVEGIVTAWLAARL